MKPEFGEVMRCESERLTESESRREANNRVGVNFGARGSFTVCAFANISWWCRSSCPLSRRPQSTSHRALWHQASCIWNARVVLCWG